MKLCGITNNSNGQIKKVMFTNITHIILDIHMTSFQKLEMDTLDYVVHVSTLTYANLIIYRMTFDRSV